jgi:hypothetical protein
VVDISSFNGTLNQQPASPSGASWLRQRYLPDFAPSGSSDFAPSRLARLERTVRQLETVTRVQRLPDGSSRLKPKVLRLGRFVCLYPEDFGRGLRPFTQRTLECSPFGFEWKVATALEARILAAAVAGVAYR